MDLKGEMDRKRQILAERARLLAQEVAQDEQLLETVEVALFTVGSEVFAIPIEHLREIVPMPTITPVPGCPEWILGVAHVRGSLLSVVHLGQFCRAKGESRIQHLAVVIGPEGPLGLTVDDVLSVRTIAAGSLSLDDKQQRRAALGVTPDLAVVLDVPFLFSLPELVVE